MKLNNKGFAITGILYTVFILFLLIITSVLAGLQLKRTMLERSIILLEDSYIGENLYESEAGKEKIKNINKTKSGDNDPREAPVTGKYIFNIRNNFYSDAETKDFAYTGTVQTFTAEKTGYYKLEVWGASGGGDNVNKGGKGGYSSGLKYLNEGETLYVYVGGVGLSNSTIENAGGWNGGGFSGNYNTRHSYGGGGATDIRTVIASETPTIWYEVNSLNNRIIVAGGGGGTSNDTDSKHFPGVGGGIIGGTGTGTYSSTDSGGGTQEGPGSAALDSKKGLFGSGVRSSVGANAGYGGGGGGGYWGGSTGHGKPGGGGSGYIGGVENGTTIAGSQDIPEYPKQDEGNGYARISYYGEDAAYQKGLITLYGYTGTVQTFKALNDGKYKIESWGAQGGGSIMGIDVGGKGGYTSGNIELIKDEVLYVYVGRRGYDNASITNIGGWNGGGYSGNNPGSNSYGGGGATDVRLVKASETATVWNEATSLRSRIMVAGGGGGGFSTPQFTQTAGVGGGLIGGTGTGSYANPDISSGGGTQTGAGTAYSDVKKGSFGYAPQSNGAGWGGGGGGGYWGGSTGNGKPGGGGSSYISGYKGSVAVASASSSAAKSGCTDGTTDVTCSYHYSEKIFENPKIYDGGSGFVRSPIGNDYMTGNIGDGYAKITYMGNGDVKVNDITCVAYLTKDTPIDFDHITFLTADCNDAKKNSLFAFDQNLTEQDYNVITLAAVYSFER